jgi:hypothetical protein
MTTRRVLGTLAAVLAAASLTLSAHAGPPFPIVSDQTAGRYVVSVWTDPDTTDDGSAGGQFWVRLRASSNAMPLPEETRATVAIRPLDRTGSERTAAATPVQRDITNQFAALVMDHEGRFAVRVAIDGPMGAATLEATVDATYDQRPPAPLLFLYLAPFVLVGLLWGRLLLRRRAERRRSSADPRDAP